MENFINKPEIQPQKQIASDLESVPYQVKDIPYQGGSFSIFEISNGEYAADVYFEGKEYKTEIFDDIAIVEEQAKTIIDEEINLSRIHPMYENIKEHNDNLMHRYFSQEGSKYSSEHLNIPYTIYELAKGEYQVQTKLGSFPLDRKEHEPSIGEIVTQVEEFIEKRVNDDKAV